jgi:Proteasome maturation factor UMP1
MHQAQHETPCVVLVVVVAAAASDSYIVVPFSPSLRNSTNKGISARTMADYMNDDTSSIPRLSKPVSVMDAGLNADRLSHSAASKHPVLNLQHQVNDPYRDLSTVRHVYGSALAMILATERTTALQQAQMNQFHGRGIMGTSSASALASSSLYGEITQGNDVDLQFEDFLGLPQDRPDMASASGGGGGPMSQLPHAIMERQLGM